MITAKQYSHYTKKTAADENSSWPTQHRSGGPGATAQLPPTSRPIVPRGAPRHAQFYALRRARLALQHPHQHVDQHAQEQNGVSVAKDFFTHRPARLQEFIQDASIYLPGAREHFLAL